MSEAVTVDVKGTQDIAIAMKGMANSVQDKMLAKAVLKGAKVIVKEAKRRAPVASGNLRKSIVALKSSKRNTPAQVSYKVGYAMRFYKQTDDHKNGFPYFVLVELGGLAAVAFSALTLGKSEN